MAADRVIGAAIPHDSARLHVSGRATYTDDITEPQDILHLAVGMSDKAHARIRSIDLSAVREAPGVVAVMTAEDIIGKNNCGPVVDDDPILAPGLVQYAGQAVFADERFKMDQPLGHGCPIPDGSSSGFNWPVQLK